MRRDCTVVIDEMVKQIPESETELLTDLQWNKEDASFKAPEETLQWHRTMETLMKHIPKPSDDWHFEVLSTFTTKSISDLKNQCYK